jgi:hypothetical protein
MTLSAHHLPRTEQQELQVWVLPRRVPCEAVHASRHGTLSVRTSVGCAPLLKLV